MKHTKTLLAISLVSLLAGCGGSDSETQYGTLDLGVADNPADAKIVNIAFRQVVLKNSEGSYSFDVTEEGELEHVNLLDYQYPSVKTLVSGQSVPVGEYQMCIYMKNNEAADQNPDSPTSSFVQTEDDSVFGLVTNSNGSCGGVGADEEDTGRIFFNKSFTIAVGENQFVADFSLGQGLQDPHGNKDYWTIKPTAVQLVNLSDIGKISGQISYDTSLACGEDQGHAVYLYPADTALEDMFDFSPTNTGSPIASARANLIDPEDETKGREYGFGFVAAGNYSLGYTCVAANDDPEAENTPSDTSDPFFIYIDEQDVSVTVDETTTRHFPIDYIVPQG